MLATAAAARALLRLLVPAKAFQRWELNDSAKSDYVAVSSCFFFVREPLLRCKGAGVVHSLIWVPITGVE